MELNKETFTMEDLKQLLKEAFEFDYDKHKGKVKFLPLTIVEWHKSDVYKELLSFDNIKGNILEWRRPFDCGGTYFFNQKSFVIFFQRTNIVKLLKYRGASIDELLASYLFAIFHELQHHYQGEFRGVIKSYEEANFSTFAYDIDCFAFSYNPQDYDKHHDEYWAEIGANLYGIDRVYEFLESKGMLTEKIEKILQKYKNKYLFDLNNYDIHYFLYRAHEILKKNLGINLGDWGVFACFIKASNSLEQLMKFYSLLMNAT